ncbi:NlpC/P60 family protein, partial [uncultured Weissella sp.]
ASVQHLPLNEAMPGDLLFWGTPDLISNAGVYLGGGRYLTVDLMGGIVMIQTVSKTWEPDFVGSLR